MSVRCVLPVIGVAAAAVLGVAQPAFAATTNGDYKGSGINIRSCNSTSCSVLGLGYQGQKLTATCYKQGQNFESVAIWIKNRDAATGVTGYSDSTYITYSGSIPPC